MHQVAPHFEVVIWRSLRDAPTCEVLLDDCLRVLAPQSLREVPTSLDGCLSLLLEHLREERALLVLDNLEVLLAEGEGRARAVCVRAMKTMNDCCAVSPKPSTRVACC